MRPFAAISRIVHRPWFETALLAICVVGFVQHGATKGTKGTNGIGQPPSPLMMPAPIIEPVAVDSTGFSLPSDFPLVTNLCFWGVSRGEGSVLLGIAWPDSHSFTNGFVDLYGHWRPSTSGWTRLAQIDVGNAASNAVVCLSDSHFPTNAMSEAAFFRLSSQSDADGDGLTNGQECEWGTSPVIGDTDGDGVSDGSEVAQYSDPIDPRDGGLPNTRIPVSFYFGDPSGSRSEKYRLEVTPVSGVGDEPSSLSWLNENYGECETRTALLKAGWKYEVKLHHAGTSGSGSGYPDYDYELGIGNNTLPDNVMVDDPDSLLGDDYTSYSFAGEGKVATISVYAVTGVAICKPDDPSWAELEPSRVVLDNEDLRIKVEIAPQISSLAQCRQAFGNSLTVKTSGTCPSGVSVPIPDNAAIVNSSGKSEVRISKTRQQLKALGLLPSQDEDGVNEMAWVDVVQTTGQSLADSEAFATLGYAFRGKATLETSETLDSTPPNSAPSVSYMKAAGA